jgi:copper chaperone CopZ
MTTTRIEFTVQMTCDNCENDIRKALAPLSGIERLEISREKQEVIVDGDVSFAHLLKALRGTNKVQMNFSCHITKNRVEKRVRIIL